MCHLPEETCAAHADRASKKAHFATARQRHGRHNETAVVHAVSAGEFV
jgi:hypothetical protein